MANQQKPKPPAPPPPSIVVTECAACKAPKNPKAKETDLCRKCSDAVIKARMHFAAASEDIFRTTLAKVSEATNMADPDDLRNIGTSNQKLILLAVAQGFPDQIERLIVAIKEKYRTPAERASDEAAGVPSNQDVVVKIVNLDDHRAQHATPVNAVPLLYGVNGLPLILTKPAD